MEIKNMSQFYPKADHYKRMTEERIKKEISETGNDLWDLVMRTKDDQKNDVFEINFRNLMENYGQLFYWLGRKGGEKYA